MSWTNALSGLKLWLLTGVVVGFAIVLILLLVSFWLLSRNKSRPACEKLPLTITPVNSKNINELKVDKVVRSSDGVLLTISDSTKDGETEKVLVHVGVSRKTSGGDKKVSRISGTDHEDVKITVQIRDDGVLLEQRRQNTSSHAGPTGEILSTGSILHFSGDSHCSGTSTSSSMDASQFAWCRFFTLRDIEVATNGFLQENVIGEGGYGVVYKGQLVNGVVIAVKNLLHKSGQAEEEFRIEVEAIGRVRHKNLVRLLGLCIEGTHRMLVYEYVDNGNLEQWLHGPLGKDTCLPWDARMKIILGTAKALAYLHDALEPKVVHRDIKSSNILVDSDWNAKVSDFGLAKLLGAGKSYVTTRVMGTFGYVAPEYANTGLLNEKSDVYSFGVLLLETITGRDPVDHARPPGEVNLVDWLKVMVGSRRSEEALDPNLLLKPSSRILKKSLLVALLCVDPDYEKRPKMGHVIHMLESEEFPYRDERRSAEKQCPKLMETES